VSGILNPKTRILDTILTDQGKRRLAAGNFQIQYVSFTDGETFYQADVVSGSDDASRRIFLEASSRRQDQITFESNADGSPVAFNTSNSRLAGKTIASGTFSEILQSSIDNFQNLRVIGSSDPFWDDDEFNASVATASFNITADKPLSDVTVASINDVESFFQDKRLAHIPNFRFLPPVLSETTQSLGRYADVSEREVTTYEQLAESLSNLEKSTVTFYDSSREGNLVAQMFETSTNQMIKLSAIDFGEFQTADDDHSLKQIFFVGKIYEDNNGMSTFVNIFTIVFD
jgi:hypothetical protein